MTKTTHLSLFKVTTSTKEIEITADHPLVCQESGIYFYESFIKKLGYSNFDQLVNQCEVLTWNNETNAPCMKK